MGLVKYVGVMYGLVGDECEGHLGISMQVVGCVLAPVLNVWFSYIVVNFYRFCGRWQHRL